MRVVWFEFREFGLPIKGDRHRKRGGAHYLRGVGAEYFWVGGDLTPKK